MNSNKNKLILNDRLDQILANDFKNDSYDSFDFINIDFILLNDIYIQITENDKYNDADVTRQVSFDAKWCLPSPYMELEADTMHEDVVMELSKRLVDGTLVQEGITEETAQ